LELQAILGKILPQKHKQGWWRVSSGRGTGYGVSMTPSKYEALNSKPQTAKKQNKTTTK
jgi:hypothetical protein